MPKLYEYFGILVLFYSNEHEPIHVHILYKEYMIIAEFIIQDGVVSEVKYKKRRNVQVLPPSQLKKAKELIELKKNEIIQKWFDYFVMKKQIKFEKITTRIK